MGKREGEKEGLKERGKKGGIKEGREGGEVRKGEREEILSSVTTCGYRP